MEATTPQPAWKTLLAFAIIYFVWGSTFLAIRVGVHAVPPLLFAAMRFTTAGILLTGWRLTRGESLPTRRQWGSVLLVAALIFLVNYGLLFWAESHVASGVAAVMMATIPVFMTVSEILLLRMRRFTARLVVALLIGIGGVAVLMSHSLNLGGAAIDRAGAIGLLIAGVSWSIASVLTRRLPLPPTRMMNAGVQMVAGGLMLAVAAVAFGELRGFDPTAISRGVWLSLAYLITFGSIIGFTAYVWLLHHESPTKVGTYAYVNPVVAVLIGYFFGGEALGLRTVVGALLVLVSVVVITTTPAQKVA